MLQNLKYVYEMKSEREKLRCDTKGTKLVFACRNMTAVLDRRRNTPTLVSAASLSESDWLSSHVLTCEDNQSDSGDEAADTSVAMTSMMTLLLHNRRMQTGVICRLLQSALAVGHVQILPGPSWTSTLLRFSVTERASWPPVQLHGRPIAVLVHLS